jgi:hypothetical protein
MRGLWAAGTCDEWYRGLLMYRSWRQQWLKYAHRTREEMGQRREGADGVRRCRLRQIRSRVTKVMHPDP